MHITIRRNETICCLIGFGIGVGCCLLYKLISNFLTPEHKNSKQRDAQTMGQEQSYSSEIAVSYSKRPRPRTTDNTSHPVAISKHEQHREERIVCDRCRHQASEQENDCEPLVGLPITKYHHEHYELKSSNPMTWSEISSSDLLESYHSNSIGDSGIESNPTGSRSKLTTKNNKKKENMNSTLNNYGYELNSTYDEYDQIFPSASSANVLGTNRKYDSDTAICQSTKCATDALQNNLMSYMTTEKGLERAIEHTTKLNQDLEMILTDFGTLSRRYSQSSVNKILTSTSSATYDNHHFQHSHTIDVLDWNYNDCSPMPQSPNSYRRQSSRNTNSSQTSNKSQNSRNKTKLKRRLNTMSSDYHESDETRSYDYTSSPLRRRPSSVYFDSSDTSDEDAPSDDILDTISSNCSSNQTNLDDTLNVEQNNDDETLSPVKMSTTTEFISCSNDSELSIETEDQNKYS
ncbi:unnamed protein product [Didymodactylos carnosus]|uniref:Uncharacterized protein n=1 Tax=Didymodactylos carnosus TaxID=1234261 RepID=A0A814IFX3_9BILA|nr:unnamed protein product [Didymodactylos carnosus]CAF1024018.1 unnamed protein product [Didymodactylos carnosus]CAF3655975.1 unnamed protein product [Didymodactylos carnosus]CAF3795307.1 unnamed protein product [Didymodactylos carnosus]